MTDIVLHSTADNAQADGAVSVISDALFGMNFLFNRDRFDTRDTLVATGTGELPATYDDAFRALEGQSTHGTTLRYPGGAVSELFLDLSVAGLTATTQGGQQVVSPVEFLDFCARTGADMTFVLPSRRFLGDGTEGDRQPDIDTAAVSSYIKGLLTEALSRGVDVNAFELGNEWWATTWSTWTASEYGRVASALAATVQQAIDEFRSDNNLGAGWTEPELLVQLGRSDAETTAIFAEFDQDSEQSAIDGLVRHRYKTGEFVDTGSQGTAFYTAFDTWDTLVAASGDADWQTDLTRHLSEWNVAGSNITERGLRAVAPFISLFADMAAAGVDAAQVWAVQQNNLTNLTFDNGLAAGVKGSNGGYWQGLSVIGEAFRLMRESLPGTHAVQIEGLTGNTLPASVAVEAFQGEDRLVLFVSNRSGARDTVSLDLGELASDANHVQAVILGVAKGNLATGPNPQPKLTVLTGKDLPIVDGVVTLTLKPWQTAQLVYTTGDTGVTLTGQNRRDGLSGSDFADTLAGMRGNDTLVGLDGGDSLFGGQGSDILTGGAGDDRMIGEAGRDVLFGGAGSDQLIGGGGADRFVFTHGDGADAITDFEDGIDRIQLSGTGLSFDDLTLRRLPNGVLVEYGDGDVIRLAGLTTAQITAEDFIFA